MRSSTWCGRAGAPCTGSRPSPSAARAPFRWSLGGGRCRLRPGARRQNRGRRRASAFAWHGDVGTDARKAFKDDPHDALLTTPESLELLLTSPSHDERSLFAGLRAVVIDEVHAFVGTPRGAQLASLLERLFQFVDADFQRIGLSATVGAPEKVLGWVRGASLREAELVVGGAAMHGEELSVRTYADDVEALDVVSQAATGHRSIVFTRSRRRAEQLAHLMGVPVHHSSIAAEGREDVVRRLRDGELPCVVATASLELGIDIGDLDLVVHDGAPTSPSSYLQRLGRTGRRSGRRRMVFTVGQPDQLVLVLATVLRARRNHLEQVDPQRGARLVLGQQALAVTQQSFLVDRSQLGETLRWSPTFAGLDAEIEATIDHLIAEQWLRSDGDRLVPGRRHNERFGGVRGIVQLLATFQSSPGAMVVEEAGRKVGTVDWRELDDRDGGRRDAALVVSGRSWEVVRVDRREGILVVKPGKGGKPPSWQGPMVEVERATWEAVREVLANTDVPVDADARAHDWLSRARSAWAGRLETPARSAGDRTVVDSFCGVPVHRAALAALGVEGRAEGATCEIASPLPVVAERARALLDEFDAVLDADARRVAPQLQVRFPDLVAPAVLLAEARRFHVDADGLHRFLTLVAES
jgi:ATP-dependent helicase Lhr and Lhr-like helicase